MKNLAITLAAVLAVLGNPANADSAVSEAALLTLAMTSPAMPALAQPLAAESIDTDALASEIELKVSASLEKLTSDLDKKLEARFAKEIEYAMP